MTERCVLNLSFVFVLCVVCFVFCGVYLGGDSGGRRQSRARKPSSLSANGSFGAAPSSSTASPSSAAAGGGGGGGSGGAASPAALSAEAIAQYTREAFAPYERAWARAKPNAGAAGAAAGGKRVMTGADAQSPPQAQAQSGAGGGGGAENPAFATIGMLLEAEKGEAFLRNPNANSRQFMLMVCIYQLGGEGGAVEKCY